MPEFVNHLAKTNFMPTNTQNTGSETSLPINKAVSSSTGRGTVIIVGSALLVMILGVLASLSFRFYPDATGRLTALLVTLFSREERIEILTDKSQTEINETFTISYKHIGRDGNGTYVLNYPCSTETVLGLSSIVGTSTQTSAIGCDNQFDITPKEGEKFGSISLAAISTTETISAVPVTISFLPQGTTTPSVNGSVIVVVENSNPKVVSPVNGTPTTTPVVKKPTPPKVGTPTTTYVPITNETTAGPVTTTSYPIAGGAPVQNGQPDLATRIIEIGTVDKITGAFTATSSFKSSDRIAVKFEVRNDGGRDSGSWYFNAVLPTFPSHIFTSPSQNSLIPGARIEFTLGFDNIAMQPNFSREFVANADPGSSIGEANETNNIAKVMITNVTQ